MASMPTWQREYSTVPGANPVVTGLMARKLILDRPSRFGRPNDLFSLPAGKTDDRHNCSGRGCYANQDVLHYRDPLGKRHMNEG
jgi:hypothetical protein